MTGGAATLGTLSHRFGEGWRRAAFGWRRARRLFHLPVAERLLIAPQELELGDPSVAISFYSGHLVFAGRTMQTRGQSPFRLEPPSPPWAEELHGFSWLRHFRESENPVVRHHARALIDDWLNQRDVRSSPLVQAPTVAARRMIAWLVNSPLLLTEADRGFYDRFMRQLARQAQWLDFCASRTGIGLARLEAAIAYTFYTLCAMTGDADWKRASRLLADALGDTLLADGCPISRNPADALAIAALLLPLRTAYAARGRTPPVQLETGIDRLMTVLRLMRHTEGSLALFNGMSATPFHLLGAVLAFADGKTELPREARYGGYHRLEQGSVMLICDVGAAPRPEAAMNAHAGTLSFELSAGPERIVVNCGAPPAGLTDLREALRETAAHSTLSFENQSSAKFRAFRDGAGIMRHPMVDTGERPAVTREHINGGERLSLIHDGYRKSLGVVHHRTLTLSEDGGVLAGTDRLEYAARPASANDPAPVLRFHLHPRAAASPVPGHSAVRIDLPDGGLWTFEADAAEIVIEDSIFLGGLASQRRATQIVVKLENPEQGVTWNFTRRTPAPTVLARRATPG